jgi:hypothetical protein
MENTIMTKQTQIIRVLFAAACSFCFLHATAQAQEVTRMRTDHAVSLDMGLESALVMRLGYSHRGDFLGEDSRIYAHFTLPAAEVDLGDFAFDAGVRMHLYEHEGWGVQALAGPVMHRAENELFAATGLGVRAVVLPGYQSEGWGLMLDLGIEQMFATQVTHSDLYRSTYYAGARDGWYAMPGSTLHAGVRTGFRIRKLELSMSGGVMTDIELKPNLSPFYLMLGSAYTL